MTETRFSRRSFLNRAALFSAAVGVSPRFIEQGRGAEFARLPVVVFSKLYQELKLDFRAAAEVTKEAGLDGIDCPVRPGGEVVPERAAEDMSRYAEALREFGLGMPLLTTGIGGVSSPHAEEILRTGKRLGAQYYRLGYAPQTKGETRKQQIANFRAQLKDLAAMNKAIGICGVYQNHSPAEKYVGGDIAELNEIVTGFDPAQIGLAFDVGHALVVHGLKWREHWEALKPHVKVVYVKDVTLAGKWVPFGTGEIGKIAYFKLLKEMAYTAPISLHVEFDWAGPGNAKDRATLVRVLRENTTVLRKWLAEA